MQSCSKQKKSVSEIIRYGFLICYEMVFFVGSFALWTKPIICPDRITVRSE